MTHESTAAKADREASNYEAILAMSCTKDDSCIVMEALIDQALVNDTEIQMYKEKYGG